MSVGYLAIIILRNKPSDIGLPNFENEECDNVTLIETKENQNLDNDGLINDEEKKLNAESDENINYDENFNDNYDDDEDEDDQTSRWEQIKIFLKYPFFISICLTYFITQLLKTLYSDWSQIYLTKALRVDHYNGIFLLIALNPYLLNHGIKFGSSKNHQKQNILKSMR
jgi:sugar phosphate permease